MPSVEVAVSGSSPLTRGKLPYRECEAEGGRLIPAHAGKTVIWCVPFTIPWAHPRSRGENRPAREHCRAHAGSSPLTRGKPVPGPGVVLRVRLIPAHAGKTFAMPRQPWPVTAHPRSRGENIVSAIWAKMFAGSSPLTRGKRRDQVTPHTGSGLIPAHAGKTGDDAGKHERAGAHPRSRGENHIATYLARYSGGSSPLTRGKPDSMRAVPGIWRLIPAHAGKTVQGSDPFPPSAAHPRSRGENTRASGASPQSAGSSPLTRGKQHEADAAATSGRLIPAHAGKTNGLIDLWAQV